MLDALRHKLAALIAPGTRIAPVRPSLQTRMYQSAKSSRMTAGWSPGNTTADAELAGSLTTLRNRSRALVRDAGYAKRAKVVIVNNVIGNGIPFQAQVRTNGGDLNKRLNDAIEAAWGAWACADNCHTGGQLHFADFERAAFGQIFEAGEVLIRLHPRAFGDTQIPLALELIEPERLADNYQFPAAQAPGAYVEQGVELDDFYRPLAYWIRKQTPRDRHYGYAAGAELERVPADQVLHLRVISRWPQTRGEPWLHCAIRKLNDMDGYSEAEIFAARAAANYFGAIEKPEAETPPLGTPQADGSQEYVIEPGEFTELAAGEKLNWVSPNRPNAAMDPFMRMMLREVAAAVGTSYESLSRDYSQSNYSSSRLALLEDRDLWRVHQGLWLRSFRQPLHKVWLAQAVLARAIPGITVEAYALAPEKFEAAMFKPRGWSWVDPTKEVEAYIAAVRAGFMTVSDVIALTGGGQDLEEVITQRVQELEMMHDAGLVFDTDPAADSKPQSNTAAAPPPEDDTGAGDGADENKPKTDPPARVFSFPR